MKEKDLISLKALAQDLEGDLYADELSRYMLATDGSIYRKQPLCVVYPKSSDDVEAVVRYAGKNQYTVHPRGAGSGLCGSALGDGIVLDFTRYMNGLIRIDLENRWFECEPGYRFGELEAELKGSGLFFPPDPSSGEYASFGGMYGTNASGAHSVKYGNVADYILDAELQFADGSRRYLSEIETMPLKSLPENLRRVATVYLENAETIEQAYPEIRCNVAGYNLRGLVSDGKLHLHRLLAGSEGTLGVVTRLKFRLQVKPTADSMVVAFFDDITQSARAVQKVTPLLPSGIEVMDKSLLNLAKENDPQLRDNIPDGVDNVLLIEFDGFDEDQVRLEAEKAKHLLENEGLSNQVHLAASAEEKARFWAVRKAAVPILYKLKGEKKILALIEDAAIPIDGLVDYFDGIYRILNQHQLRFVVYGHIAKGLMHTRPLLNLKDETDISLLKILADEVYDLVTRLNGTVSGEHGDGRIRSAYVKRRYPEIYHLFQAMKQAFDPANIFNPEIIINPDETLLFSNLRYGSAYSGEDLAGKQLLWDEGFMAQVETCHGCSKCTTITTITRMCPLYKFTRDEAASPKAKANILRALISGAIASRSLYEKQFQTVINLCVNCGSCYQECPSNVNIPKLALEAKAQFVTKFGASLHNRVVTNLEAAARLTGRFSSLLHPILQQPLSKRLLEKAVGVSSKRNGVVFARSPLKSRIREIEGRGKPSVLYFAGCYASFIRPEIGQAAVSVLTKLGFSVITPMQHCCGLPMLSKGMADEARKKIRQNLARWESHLNAIDHVVVSCSSCGLSLTQEWSYLASNDAVNIIRDKQIHISSLVNRHAERLRTLEKPMTVGYHLPCHLKLQRDAHASLSMLKRLPGVSVTDLDGHCCGMAGSWGMATEHFPLSQTIGSDLIRRLNASEAAIAATDCPTCRMQLEQFSEKPTLHPIELLADRLI